MRTANASFAEEAVESHRVRTKPSSRAGRLAVAIVGLSIAIACSGNPTTPTPPPTPVPPPVPPVTPSSTVLLWPLAGRDGRDWVINNYIDLDPTSGILDYTGASGSGAKTINGHLGIDIDVPNFRWMDGGLSIVRAAAAAGVVQHPARRIEVDVVVDHPITSLGSGERPKQQGR